MSATGITEEMVATVLKDKLSTEHVEAHDFSDGCGAKFDLIVVTKEFEGKPLLDRHRLVNEALKDLMPKIHAVTMKTWTPAQWETKKPQA